MFTNRINISNYSRTSQDDRGTSLIQDEERSLSYEGSNSSFDYDEEFELLVKAYMRDMNYTTLNQAALNIVYSILNAGLVALPFTTQEAGLPLFIGVFIIVAVLSAYTSIMVISMANQQKVRTLEDLAECAFGRKGFVAISICQIVFSFSLMCVTLDIWADIMSDVFRELDWGGWLFQTRNGQVIFGALIVFPLCLLKKSMSSLKWTSYVTVFAVISALVAVVATYVTDASVADNIFTGDSPQNLIAPRKQWWSVIFIAMFCYSCNQKVFIIYSSLRRRSTERWQKATIRSTVALTLLYLFFGVAGYLSKYRKEIHLNNFNFFLSNADEMKAVFDPARAVVVFCLLLTIPVDCLVCATTWRRLYTKYVGRYDYGDNEEYREVNCCDVIYAPVIDKQSSPCLDSTDLPVNVDQLPNAKQVNGESGFLTAASTTFEPDTSDEDIEVPETSASVLLIPDAAAAAGVMKARSPLTESQKSKRKRLRRRSRRNTSSVRFENSYSSSGTWSYLRNLLSTPAETSQNVKAAAQSIDKSTASVSEDIRLSALRESIQEGDIFGYNEQPSYSGTTNPTLSISNNTTSTTINNNFRTSFTDRNSFTNDNNNSNNNNNTNNNSNNNANARNIGNSEIPTNPSLTNMTDGRASSLDEKMFGELLDEEVPLCPNRNEFVPTFLLWLCTVGICSLAAHWMYIAAVFSVGTTLLLTFIFPTLMYFRLGLLSDFQAIPLFGEIVPNRFYMTIIQSLGIGIFIFDIILMIWLVVAGENVIRKES